MYLCFYIVKCVYIPIDAELCVCVCVELCVCTPILMCVHVHYKLCICYRSITSGYYYVSVLCIMSLSSPLSVHWESRDSQAHLQDRYHHCYETHQGKIVKNAHLLGP